MRENNYAKLIKQAGAKLVWINCMTYMFANEHSLLRQHGLFDYYIFQSLYQTGQIVPRLEKWGEPRHTLIRGYLDLEEYPYRPAERGKSDPFVICRISRQDPDKWYRRYFRLLEQLLNDPGCPPIQAKYKQVDGVVRRKLAPIPDCAYCPGLSEGDATEILYSSHCMFPINHNARENMASGGSIDSRCAVYFYSGSIGIVMMRRRNA